MYGENFLNSEHRKNKIVQQNEKFIVEWLFDNNIESEIFKHTHDSVIIKQHEILMITIVTK